MSVGAKELLHYKRAGEAATEAHSLGFASFGDTEQRNRQRQMPALPGATTGSGAIVALDREDRVAMVGGVPFADKYRQFKSQIVIRGAADTQGVQPLSKEQTQELKKFANDTSEATLVQDVAVSMPVAGQFVHRCAARAPGLLGLHWRPPVAAMVQARLVLAVPFCVDGQFFLVFQNSSACLAS